MWQRNNIEKQYLSLLTDILEHGNKTGDRTGTGTLSLFGAQIRHDFKQRRYFVTLKEILKIRKKDQKIYSPSLLMWKQTKGTLFYWIVEEEQEIDEAMKALKKMLLADDWEIE